LNPKDSVDTVPQERVRWGGGAKKNTAICWEREKEIHKLQKKTGREKEKGTEGGGKEEKLLSTPAEETAFRKRGGHEAHTAQERKKPLAGE